MGFLIDTNVLSEMRKQARANANVLRWTGVQLLNPFDDPSPEI